MATGKTSRDRSTERLDQLLEVLQDLFVLQALQMGLRGEDIRKILRIDQWRVTNISKHIKRVKNRSSQR